MSRFITDVVLIALLIFLPWWVALVGAFVLLFLYDRPIESIIIALFVDVLYAPVRIMGISFTLLFTVLFLILYMLAIPAKKRLRYYHRLS